MRKIIIMLMGCLSILMACSQVTYAVSPKWVTAVNAAKNLKEVLNEVKHKSSMLVLFPVRIPEYKKSTLYAVQSSYDSSPNYNQYWEIAIVTSQDCQVKGCKLGSLSANQNDKLELSYQQAPFGSGNKPIAKEKVQLTQKIVGYYTPGHAEADWHAPTLEWRMKQAVYKLTWDVTNEPKEALMDMANSAIRKSHHA